MAPESTVEAVTIELPEIIALKVALADAVLMLRWCEETLAERIAADVDVTVDRAYLDAMRNHDDLFDAMEVALAVMRFHPDYTEPTNG